MFGLPKSVADIGYPSPRGDIGLNTTRAIDRHHTHYRLAVRTRRNTFKFTERIMLERPTRTPDRDHPTVYRTFCRMNHCTSLHNCNSRLVYNFNPAISNCRPATHPTYAVHRSNGKVPEKASVKQQQNGPNSTLESDYRRDRPDFCSSSMSEGERASSISTIYPTLAHVRTCSVMPGHY